MELAKLSLIYYRHNRMQSFAPIAAHRLQYCELTAVLSGRMVYIIDGTECPLSAGDVIFLPTGTARARRKVEGADYVSFNFTATEPTLLDMVHRKAVDSEFNLLLMCFDECYANKQPHTRQKCESLLSVLLCKLCDLQSAPHYSKLTAKIIDYLKSNVGEKVTLNQIGKYTFFSPVYCANVFKKETGKSIINYLNNLKIDAAKEMLLQSKNLSEVALALGFSDYNYFSRLFKRLTTYSPKQYQSLLPSL